MSTTGAPVIYQHTRPAKFPAPYGTSVTLTARLDGDTVGINWQRSDIPARGQGIALSRAEFEAIHAALIEQRAGDSR